MGDWKVARTGRQECLPYNGGGKHRVGKPAVVCMVKVCQLCSTPTHVGDYPGVAADVSLRHLIGRPLEGRTSARLESLGASPNRFHRRVSDAFVEGGKFQPVS